MTDNELLKLADLDRSLSQFDKDRIHDLLREDLRRKRESLKLYTPMTEQDRAHRCQSRIRLMIGGNRGGKSVGAATEFARAVTGQDPFKKYPHKDGTAYIVGKSLRHLGITIYRLLFRAGAIRMIRDEDTGLWRTYQPWIEADRKRKDQARPAPPLIPQRFIKGKVAWHSKAKQEPDRVELTNGWEIMFFSAEGRLPQGSPIDIAWMDEECPPSPDGDWITELKARCIDRSGKIIWSATPQAGFEQLFDLFQKSEEQETLYKLDPATNAPPEIATFTFDLSDNPYIAAADKTWFLTSLSEDEARVRGAGEFKVLTQRVYPEFSPSIHCYPLGGRPKAHWTNYVFVDPGYQVCAALFVTCPPPNECPDRRPIAIGFHELYIPQCNAALFGRRMAEAAEGLGFEAFYIDIHGAPREAGSGRSIKDQYAEALRKNGVQSRLSGHDFLPANDDRKAGIMAVHDYLVVRSSGGSKFRVAVSEDDKTACRLPNLLFNMRRYRYKKVRGVVTDDPEDRGDTHLCQCLRYMAMAEPEWVEDSQTGTKKKSWHDELFDFVLEKTKSRLASPNLFNLGPAGQ